MNKPLRIPFDSVALAAIMDEIRGLGDHPRLQRVVQLDSTTLLLGLYAKQEHLLLISTHADFARMHFIARRPPSPPSPLPFAAELRKWLPNATLVRAQQIGFDRVVHLDFASREGEFTLVAELMGKHSNLVLVDDQGKLRAGLKWIGPGKSKRPLLPGQPYLPPPFPPRTPLLAITDFSEWETAQGVSPFLVKLVKSGLAIEDAHRLIKTHDWSPLYAPGAGAYPLPLKSLGIDAVPRSNLSLALEQHFSERERQLNQERERSSLIPQLERVMLARQVALRGLNESKATAERAAEIQTQGDLILAYQHQVKPGDTQLDAWDYAGEPIVIPLDPDLTPVENADRLFQKARSAKDHYASVSEQAARLKSDLSDIESALSLIRESNDLAEVRRVRELAEKKRWLHQRTTGVGKSGKAERPFEGKAVRELVSPGGWKVYYGENAEANDYVTTRLGRPNDYWLHVRGETSAHVLLATMNQPQRVQMDDLLFAARVAVRHSASKHAGVAAVDYTLRKYVRKPKGSAVGFATYTREKTLHVEREK